MPIKVTRTHTSKVSISKSPELSKVLRNSLNTKKSGGYLTAVREEFRALDKKLLTQVQDTRGLLHRLNNSPQYILDPKEAAALSKLENVAPLEECRQAMMQLQKAINSVEGEPYQLDHLTMEPVMQAVSFLIVAYQDAVNTMLMGKPFTQTDIGQTYVKGSFDPFTPSIPTLNSKILFLQNLRVYYGLWKKNNMNMFEAQKEAQRLAGGAVLDIDYLKVNDLDFTKSGKQVEIQVISKQENMSKGQMSTGQGAFGVARMTGLRGDPVAGTLAPQIISAIKNNGILNIVGSPDVGKTLKKQVGQVFRGEKITKAKSNTRKKVLTEKIPELQAPKRLTKFIDQTTNADIAASIALLGTKVQLAGKRRRRDTGDAQRELNKIRALINRRLPAQVRKNMGRPTLENQTGRFSESVQLLRLQQARKFTHAQYTYLLDPYETFENTGEKDWPRAYNPKPIIEESIRDLANVEGKFTFRFFRV